MKSSQTLHDPAWPVVLKRMGRSIFDPIWAEQQHTDADSELLHVLRGKVRIETPRYQINGREGDTLYTPANMPHRDIFAPGTVFEVYLVQFHWAEEADVLRRFTVAELVRVSRRSQATLRPAFDQLYHEFRTGLPFCEPLLSTRLGQILYELCRTAALTKEAASASSAQVRQGRRKRIMTEARRLIEQWLHEPISLDRLAEAIGVSPYYLSRVFSQESGFTLSSYLTRVRLDRAEQLLSDTDLPIKRIAYAVGYRDGHYFSRVFRARHEITPSAYRRSVQQRWAGG